MLVAVLLTEESGPLDVEDTEDDVLDLNVVELPVGMVVFDVEVVSVPGVAIVVIAVVDVVGRGVVVVVVEVLVVVVVVVVGSGVVVVVVVVEVVVVVVLVVVGYGVMVVVVGVDKEENGRRCSRTDGPQIMLMSCAGSPFLNLAVTYNVRNLM